MTGSLQVKKGFFFVVVNLYDDEGKRKPKWVSTGISALPGNKREAEKKMREILSIYEKGKVVAYEGRLFSDCIADWIVEIKPSVEQITWESYTSYATNHLIPYFSEAKIKLSTLTPKHLENYYKYKLENGRIRGTGGLSANSIKKHAVVIHGVLRDALKKNLIPYNPAERASLPKCDTSPVGKFYNPEQVKRLLELVKGTSIEAAVFLTVYYGFRRSEVCGLKWDAIDFDADTLLVKHTVVKFRSRIEKDRTKNKSSRRSYPLLSNVRAFLVRLRIEQANYEKLFGDRYTKNDYVCTWPDGRPLEPDYVTRKFKQILRQNNMPEIRFHDLRHTTATVLLSIGFSLKEIGDWLGHRDFATTANIYAHLDFKSKIDMAEKLQDCFSPDSPKKQECEANPVIDLLKSPVDDHDPTPKC